MRYSRFAPLILAIGALLTLTACGTTATATLASSAAGSSGYRYSAPAGGAAPTTAPAAAGATVDVRLTEFSIAMPASINAGSTTFKVTNAGSAVHNFVISGNGVDRKFDANLNPGETKTLQLDLQPGTYTVYCPVDSHKDKGMKADLVVK